MILLFTVLLFTTFLLLSYPLFLFPYLPKLSVLLFLLPLLFLTTLLSIPLTLLIFLPQTGPIVFPGSPPDFPYFGTPLSGSDSTFPNTVSLPSHSLPSMVTPTTIPIPFFSTGSQSTSGSGSFKRCGRGSRGTYSGRGRAPRSRIGKITSTTSCQTSPIPSYFWPDYQPSPISSGGSSANDALDLALMPRVFDHFPTSLPLNPLHYDFFTILRAASPVVTFHCPSPLTQKSFSSVDSINFPCGHDPKPLLVAGIKQ